METPDHVGNLHGFLTEPESWVALAFVIFVILFGAKLWRALTSVLDKRAETVRAELEEAVRLRREAEAMLSDASKRRDAALSDAQALLAQSRTEATRLTEAARAEAEQAARRRERMAADRIAAAEKAALSEIRAAAATVAVRAAEHVLRAGLTTEADAPLIEQAISGLPTAFTGRRAA